MGGVCCLQVEVYKGGAGTSKAEVSTVTPPCPAAERPSPNRSIARDAAVPTAGPAMAIWEARSVRTAVGDRPPPPFLHEDRARDGKKAWKDLRSLSNLRAVIFPLSQGLLQTAASVPVAGACRWKLMAGNIGAADAERPPRWQLMHLEQLAAVLERRLDARDSAETAEEAEIGRHQEGYGKVHRVPPRSKDVARLMSACEGRARHGTERAEDAA